jgi:uncharacterized membrane protein YfhO
MSLTYDTGWRVWVDGKKTRLRQGNGPHCVIPINSGTHTIVMKYLPPKLIPGAIISMITFIGAFFFAWSERKRNLRA